MLTGFGQLDRLGKIRSTRAISRISWSFVESRTGLLIPSSALRIAEALVLQVEHSTKAIQDFIVQLRTICDSVLYAYLSKIADTAEKRHYLHALCTAVEGRQLSSREVHTFLNLLHKLQIFDLHHSVFRPYDLRVLLAPMSDYCSTLWQYFWTFRSDPERSREFHYDPGPWHAFLATRYMRLLRTLSDSR